MTIEAQYGEAHGSFCSGNVNVAPETLAEPLEIVLVFIKRITH